MAYGVKVTSIKGEMEMSVKVGGSKVGRVVRITTPAGRTSGWVAHRAKPVNRQTYLGSFTKRADAVAAVTWAEAERAIAEVRESERRVRAMLQNDNI